MVARIDASMLMIILKPCGYSAAAVLVHSAGGGATTQGSAAKQKQAPSVIVCHFSSPASQLRDDSPLKMSSD
eukprot:scaffold251_cov78-Skeletonema_dohrnii-CCMP3373.AAC.5